MPYKNEETVLTEFLREKDLKLTEQRKTILKFFLGTEIHISAEELYDLIKQSHPGIGLTTVYRTLKLFCDSGLANEIKFADGVSRYEHRFEHAHHDHLICIQCGKYIEVVDPEIEALQQRLALRHRFRILNHRMELYGVCSDCAGDGL